MILNTFIICFMYTSFVYLILLLSFHSRIAYLLLMNKMFFIIVVVVIITITIIIIIIMYRWVTN